MRKTKGYAKGGAKMMRAMKGKMAKGYAKGGAKMMKAMGGRMASKGGRKMMGAMKGKMAKGYSKGGVKKFNQGRIVKKLTPTTIKTPTPSKTKNLSQMLRPNQTGKNTGIQFGQLTKMLNKARQDGGKFSVADVKFAYNSAMGDKKTRPIAKSRLTKEGKKLVKKKNKNN